MGTKALTSIWWFKLRHIHAKSFAIGRGGVLKCTRCGATCKFVVIPKKKKSRRN